MKKTIPVKTPDWMEVISVTGNTFTLQNFEEIELIAFKSKIGYLIFETSTGLCVHPFCHLKTKNLAINATLVNFNRYGKQDVLNTISENLKVPLTQRPVINS